MWVAENLNKPVTHVVSTHHHADSRLVATTRMGR